MRTLARSVARFTDYEDQSEGADTELVIPEDLSALSTEELTALHESAMAAFDGLYGDGTGLTPEDLEALAVITDGIEALNTESTSRKEADAARSEQAAELAARIRPEVEETDETLATTDEEGFLVDDDGKRVLGEDGEPVKPEVDAGEDTGEDADEDSNKELVSASGEPKPKPRGDIRVAMRSRARNLPRNISDPHTMRDVVLAADVPGYSAGQGMDWNDLGAAVDRRLTGFNASQYASANKAGRHMREQNSVAILHKPSNPDLIVASSDPSHVESVFARAVDESRLPGGSLVASGGWCAPSETLYDLMEMESRDGLVSLPEVGVSRGGINFTPGPDFATIYGAVGFTYTEQDDIDGDYDGQGGGVKPCYTVPCPDFTEVRLGLDGVCISAGLLQQRGYPEVIARTIRGALIAHDHKMSANTITGLVAGSTAVTMTAAQVGALAPVLDSIELQAEHYRYKERMSRNATLEAVFPYWIRGVIRSDLSRRLGIDLISVPDARIDGWFRDRKINPQYVYDWQPLTGAADAFKAWPATVQFLLYAAGTWVRGTSDVITLDTLYDSVNLGTNDYTALFTEEGSLLAKRGHDSRVITVATCPSGETGAGVDIACDGTLTPAA